MMAQEIVNYCAEQLGITCNSNLVNPYLVKEFDLTGGYLDLIGRLLLVKVALVIVQAVHRYKQET